MITRLSRDQKHHLQYLENNSQVINFPFLFTGEVCEVVIMYDQEKKKSRGFGFLSFEDEMARERAVAEHFVAIQNKQVKAE